MVMLCKALRSSYSSGYKSAFDDTAVCRSRKEVAELESCD